jgi:hypothetical protein
LIIRDDEWITGQGGGIYFSSALKQTKREVSHRGHGGHGGLSPCPPCPLWEIIIKEKVNAVALITGRLALYYLQKWRKV